jgi:hypothetical protein
MGVRGRLEGVVLEDDSRLELRLAGQTDVVIYRDLLVDVRQDGAQLDVVYLAGDLHFVKVS